MSKQVLVTIFVMILASVFIGKGSQCLSADSIFTFRNFLVRHNGKTLMLDDTDTNILEAQDASMNDVLGVYNRIIRFMDPASTEYLKNWGSGGIGIGEPNDTKMFVLKYIGHWMLFPTASCRQRLNSPENGNRTLNVLKDLIAGDKSKDVGKPKDPKFELTRSEDETWRITVPGNGDAEKLSRKGPEK